MFAGYSGNHKTYRLIDVDTDRFIFSRDVVFDEGGPFQLFSPVFSSEDQPLKAKDLGVQLPLAPLEGRDSADSDTKIVESPRQDLVSPDFPQEHLDQHPNEFIPRSPSHTAYLDLYIGPSTLWPKWWEKTIVVVCDD